MSKRRNFFKGMVKFFLFFCAALVCFQTFFFRTSVVEGSSMQPTLNSGDFMLIDRTSVAKIKRGDIVSCRYPNDSTIYIKRVIGIGGDKIRVENGKIYRNDVDITDVYYEGVSVARDFDEVIVPEYSYFVIGDNINDSYDSRRAGPVKQSAIIGVAVARLSPYPKTYSGDDFLK